MECTGDGRPSVYALQGSLETGVTEMLGWWLPLTFLCCKNIAFVRVVSSACEFGLRLARARSHLGYS